MSVFVRPSAGERFGTLLRLRAAGEFTFRLSRYPPRSTTPTHHHSEAFFCYVAEGLLIERGGIAGETLLPAGSLHFHAAGDPHSASAGAHGMTCLSIVPGGELASCLQAAFMPMPVQPLPAPLAALGRFCHRAFHARGADGAALATAALDLTSAFLEQSRHAGAGVRPGWLDDLRHYMELNFAESLTLRDLAMRAGVHDVHVIRTFRRHWGTTPARYLLLLRVRAARAALADPARSIADIAAEVGFSSQAHLTDRFRREIGLPPAAWRRRLQAAAG